MVQPVVSYEDFQKLDIRVVRITSVEKVDKSEKLLKLIVNTGEDERVVLAGIARDYDPDELIGRKVVAVLNMEPRRILGIESKGMLLAAEEDALLSLLVPDKDVSEGSRIG
ncbi:MAG: methionine--tRNA ligase subunit beta [Candidatus Micrarchaeia archaeon]